jgi:hypothetical protein
MDLLELIKDKCDLFSDSDIGKNLTNVITHIEVAEQHLENGKLGDEYLFTDVIYRCNQAFEGSIKEAYRVFNGSAKKNVKAYSIEQYFEEEGILRGRVLSLFTNYRTQWRNESTHNYNLNFSNQEAFLALVSICAFFNILLDEMLIKKAYYQETEEFSTNKNVLSLSFKKQSLIDEVIQILLEFSKSAPSKMKGTAIPRYFEKELLGSISAYVNLVDSNLKAITEYQFINEKYRMNPDILITNGENRLLIEIKNPMGDKNRKISDARAQLLSYMHFSGINEGIIYIPPIKMDDEMITNVVKDISPKFKIIEVYPSFLVNSEQ